VEVDRDRLSLRLAVPLLGGIGEAGRGELVEDSDTDVGVCIGTPTCDGVVVIEDDDDDDERTRWTSKEAEPMRWSGEGDPPDDGVCVAMNEWGEEASP
jgi:hypothetical protein